MHIVSAFLISFVFISEFLNVLHFWSAMQLYINVFNLFNVSFQTEKCEKSLSFAIRD